ncbi:DUF5067 domain-containing protein [Corynebacterium felinum]|uniref:DUF5067 domain-containing protein n=1 Tax=Corynebacterium felinum TaxID=131318 RepID=A0ABU2B540_9CORY|nr:DUF5067 domain-containing protein [Corynebacterium felinum]MDF5821682.1 DUF5067 domain-containing protein [Corynebacterium felinum]MDR7353725.1 hypothetical protein [Corynebacterium felinum]WJY95904.1 hypothetical protein CFELI_11610 [Corynebacterium felinum]
MRTSLFATLVFSATILSGCASTATTTNETLAGITQTLTIEAEEQSDFNPTFAEGTLHMGDFSITIVDSRTLAPGEPGNELGTTPVHAFWYDVTNHSDKIVTTSEFFSYFKAVQDNDPNLLNSLIAVFSPDPALEALELEEIKNGGTVRGAIAYELSDDITPVTLIARDPLAGTEYGRQEFPLGAPEHL